MTLRGDVESAWPRIGSSPHGAGLRRRASSSIIELYVLLDPGQQAAEGRDLLLAEALEGQLLVTKRGREDLVECFDAALRQRYFRHTRVRLGPGPHDAPLFLEL